MANEINPGVDDTVSTEQEPVQSDREMAAALYFSQRLAYNTTDTRQPIGRYNSRGEVERFKPWAQ